MSCLLSSTAPDGEPIRYRIEVVALVVLGLALLSVVSVLACRRLHHGRLQRLQEFDTEQGAIDGLITSNVGDSTLAVRKRDPHAERFLQTLVSVDQGHSDDYAVPSSHLGPAGPLLYIGKRLRSSLPGSENCGQTDQSGGVCR